MRSRAPSDALGCPPRCTRLHPTNSSTPRMKAPVTANSSPTLSAPPSVTSDDERTHHLRKQTFDCDEVHPQIIMESDDYANVKAECRFVDFLGIRGVL